MTIHNVMYVCMVALNVEDKNESLNNILLKRADQSRQILCSNDFACLQPSIIAIDLANQEECDMYSNICYPR